MKLAGAIGPFVLSLLFVAGAFLLPAASPPMPVGRPPDFSRFWNRPPLNVAIGFKPVIFVSTDANGHTVISRMNAAEKYKNAPSGPENQTAAVVASPKIVLPPSSNRVDLIDFWSLFTQPPYTNAAGASNYVYDIQLSTNFMSTNFSKVMTVAADGMMCEIRFPVTNAPNVRIRTARRKLP